MPSHRNIVIGAALAHLRKAILLCSLLVGASLILQTLIWSLATFTDLRWAEPDPEEATPLIVVSDGAVTQDIDDMDPAQAIRAAAATSANESASVPNVNAPAREDEGPELVASNLNATMAFAYRCALGLGSVGIIALMPCLMLAVLIAASGAMRGCEKTVSAFTLTILLAIMVLPLGHHLSMPWNFGALGPYDYMAAQVDAFRGGPAEAMGPIMFYARFLMMPVACLIGLALIYLRFSASVELTILAGDEFRVDPDIESEAASVQVGQSGTRTSHALDQAVAVQEQQPLQAPLNTEQSTSMAPPKRLI